MEKRPKAKPYAGTTTDVELAEIELRVAARNYAEYADDPTDRTGERAKHYKAMLREAAENYAAAKFGSVKWKLSS